eukprot:2258946-Pyramimonas_sp.AAC.1
MGDLVDCAGQPAGRSAGVAANIFRALGAGGRDKRRPRRLPPQKGGTLACWRSCQRARDHAAGNR